jgi:hypothetical protein
MRVLGRGVDLGSRGSTRDQLGGAPTRRAVGTAAGLPSGCPVSPAGGSTARASPSSSGVESRCDDRRSGVSRSSGHARGLCRTGAATRGAARGGGEARQQCGVRRGGAEARQRGRREERRSALAFSQNFTAGERRARHCGLERVFGGPVRACGRGFVLGTGDRGTAMASNGAARHRFPSSRSLQVKTCRGGAARERRRVGPGAAAGGASGRARQPGRSTQGARHAGASNGAAQYTVSRYTRPSRSSNRSTTRYTSPFG